MSSKRSNPTEIARDPDLAGAEVTMRRAARRNQFLAGFLRDFNSSLAATSYMEARGEGFLKLVRDSERLSDRHPLLEQMGEATKLTFYAARCADG